MLQIKQFANGVTAILKPQTKNSQAILRLFDKDKCLIAQREILSMKDGPLRPGLKKLTVRADKEKGIISEYLGHYRTTGYTERSVRVNKGPYDFANDYVNFNNKDKSIDYIHQSGWNMRDENTVFNKGVGRFPLTKATRTTVSKMSELEELTSKMWKQWFGFTRKKGGYEHEIPKPMSFPSYKEFLG